MAVALYIIEQQSTQGFALRRLRVTAAEVERGELEQVESLEAARARIRLELPDALLLQPPGIEPGIEVWG